MTTPVNEDMIEAWRQSALEYLRSTLRERAPTQLGAHHVYANAPLEGEGPIVLFEFSPAAGSPEAEQRHFVAAGRTEPNYYAAAGLSADDVFALHLGTRFMLVLGVALVPQPDRAGIDLDRAVQELVWSVRPGESISDLEWAAAFDVEGCLHGVARCRVGGQAAYAFIVDAPPGFSTQIEIPPQVAYRIHLGRALLAEMDRGDDESSGDEISPGGS